MKALATYATGWHNSGVAKNQQRTVRLMKCVELPLLDTLIRSHASNCYWLDDIRQYRNAVDTLYSLALYLIFPASVHQQQL